MKTNGGPQKVVSLSLRNWNLWTSDAITSNFQAMVLDAHLSIEELHRDVDFAGRCHLSPCPLFFFPSNAFLASRQVVTHIQSRQTVELYFTCRAVTLSKATKVPVVDQYAVQKLSQQENRKTKKQTKNNTAKTGKTLSPCPLELNGILQTPWYQRTLRFFEDGDFLQIYTSTMLHTELATRVTASHRLPGPPHRGELPIAFASDAINRLSLHGFSAQPIGDAAQHFQLCLTAWARDIYIRTNMQEVTVDEILLFLPEEDNVNFYAAQILTPMDALDLYYMITEHLLHSTEDDWKLGGHHTSCDSFAPTRSTVPGVRQRHHFDPWDPTVLTLTTGALSICRTGFRKISASSILFEIPFTAAYSCSAVPNLRRCRTLLRIWMHHLCGWKSLPHGCSCPT